MEVKILRRAVFGFDGDIL